MIESLVGIIKNGNWASSQRLLRAGVHSYLWLVSVTSAPIALADQRPLWELGIGVLPSTFPAYRGSEDQENYILPFPYLVYRGKVFKSDRKGIRALLFRSRRVEVNVSTNAAIPVRSDNNRVRHDMPDLDPTFEIGPSLDFRIADLSPYSTLNLKLPVRSAFSTDFSRVDHIGWVTYPHLNLDVEHIWGGWDFGVNFGPLFATRPYHDYYYRVEPEYALPDRPEYRPSGGYSGSSLLGSFGRHFNRLWIGGFARYDYLGGAEFNDSPLVDTDHSFMAGVAVAWVFAKSSRTAVH